MTDASFSKLSIPHYALEWKASLRKSDFPVARHIGSSDHPGLRDVEILKFFHSEFERAQTEASGTGGASESYQIVRMASGCAKPGAGTYDGSDKSKEAFARQIAKFEVFKEAIIATGTDLNAARSPTGRDVWIALAMYEHVAPPDPSGLVRQHMDRDTAMSLLDLGAVLQLNNDHDNENVFCYLAEYARADKTEFISFLFDHNLDQHPGAFEKINLKTSKGMRGLNRAQMKHGINHKQLTDSVSEHHAKAKSARTNKF